MSTNVVPLRRDAAAGLQPPLIPAEELGLREWLVCGRCGHDGLVKFYTWGETDFEAVCNCPRSATLIA